MDTLLQQFESLVTDHLSAFATFLAKEHDLVLADVEKSLETFLSAVTKSSGTDPKSVATKISTISKGEDDNSESSDEHEIKTRILGDEETGDKSKKLVIKDDEDEEGTTTVDSESEDVPPPKKGKAEPVEDSEVSESEVVASEDSEDVPEPPKKEKAKKGKTVPVVEEEESEVVVASEESEEEVPPPKKGKAKPAPKKGKSKPVEVVVESEDSEEIVDDESESLPPPKKGKPAPKKGKTSPTEDEDDSEPKPKEKKGKKAAEPKADGEMELSDTPKLPVKDRPAKMPKGIKFLKGTNNIVHGGVVVASLSKKGIGKLTNVNIKPLESKGIEYQVWDDAKIKKTFK